ncbi:MAG: META domain-containing protein [Acidobacteria bacterium]|nr:META domain-containing protein [Acidobacteriota bacterium]
MSPAGESITGNARCNSVGGTYDIAGGLLTLDALMTAAFCGPDDGSLMRSEEAFAAVVHGGTVEVSFRGDRMVWSNGVDSLEFVSVDTLQRPRRSSRHDSAWWDDSIAPPATCRRSESPTQVSLHWRLPRRRTQTS